MIGFHILIWVGFVWQTGYGSGMSPVAEAIIGLWSNTVVGTDSNGV